MREAISDLQQLAKNSIDCPHRLIRSNLITCQGVARRYPKPDELTTDTQQVTEGSEGPISLEFVLC